jgi:hypothetical protein
MDSDNIWEMPSYYVDMVGQFLVIIPPSFDMQNHNLWGRSSILVGRNPCYTFSVEPYKYIQIQHPPQKKTCIQCVEFHGRSWSGSFVGNTKEIAERFHTSPPQFASKMRCNVLVDYVPGFFPKQHRHTNVWYYTILTSIYIR